MNENEESAANTSALAGFLCVDVALLICFLRAMALWRRETDGRSRHVRSR